MTYISLVIALILLDIACMMAAKMLLKEVPTFFWVVLLILINVLDLLFYFAPNSYIHL